MWNVELTTNLVSHRVVHTEECICKCHTCETRSVVHLLASFCVGTTVVVASLEVLEYHLDSLDTETVCIVVSHC